MRGKSIIEELERQLQAREVHEEGDFATMIVQSTIDGIYTYDRDLTVTLWNPAMERISGMKKEDVLGRNIFDCFPFLQKFGLQHLILDPLRGRTVLEQEIPFDIPSTGRRGFARRLSCPLVGDDGKVAGGLGIVHEITGQKRAETAAEIHRRAEKRLEFLSEAGILLSSTLEYTEVLKRIIELSTKQFGAWCKLRLLEDDGSLSVFEGHQDRELAARFEQIEAKYPPPEDLQSGPHWILKNGGHQFQPVLKYDPATLYSKDPEFLALLDLMKAYICVPLQAKGRIFGTYSLVGTDRPFTEEDLSLAHDLARWIALALGNARLFARGHQT